jgi:hypothetical protein
MAVFDLEEIRNNGISSQRLSKVSLSTGKFCRRRVAIGLREYIERKWELRRQVETNVFEMVHKRDMP